MLVEIALVLALQDSTTNCRTFAGQTTCQTTAGPRNGFDAYNAARAAQAEPPRQSTLADAMECTGGDWLLVGCSLGAHREARRLRDEQERSRTARDRTMTLLRQGDCQAAVATALDTGDLRFAGEVRAFCAAGQTPAQ